MARAGLSHALVLRSLSRSARSGVLETGWLRARCAIGRNGVKARKREGDGATPAGIWRVVRVLWRSDRTRRPVTRLPVRALSIDDGWCDAPSDRNYNRAVRHPYPASAEQLWRRDHLYDIVVVLDHNQRPRIKGCGSAVFVHLARPGYEATEGCIALGERDLRRWLAMARPGTRLVIGAPIGRPR